MAKNLSTGAQATIGNFVPGPSRKLVLLFFMTAHLYFWVVRGACTQ